MSVSPTSHFITLTDCPVVQENGDVVVECLKLHYWEWKGHRSATILFCHAASFHGRCYDRIIEGALNGYRVIALDLRGHGQSQKHPPPYRFCWFGNDVLKFIEQMNLCEDHLIGIGHSVGGYALTWAAAKASKRLFQSLLLLDPGVVPRLCYGIGDQKVDALQYILRRSNRWSSVDEMLSRLEKRSPFSYWPKDVLLNYCIYALDENNDLQLSSEGEYSMYLSGLSSSSNIFPLIEQSRYIHDIPIHVVRSSLPLIIGRFETSPTEPDLAKSFRKGKDTYLKNVKHFFPMDHPQIVIDLVKEHLHSNIRSHL